jgi:hypothetical protein
LKTDFKRTDGVPSRNTKSLPFTKTNRIGRLWSIWRKVLALKFAGEHLTLNYHTAVTIRSLLTFAMPYESAIGSFCPPPGGAELIDPQMRNSIEFQEKWFSRRANAKKLHGKKSAHVLYW